ncbi:hypothetical protein HPB52_015475 [Rhipicephalus sanguineus]|uniref:Uncharacterized protein n=1 Tax=Rhipicephalus sanguineus TaxID=34632 RepID=A0A9D4SR44_RHISA|nr:hypothetical protein HPB52_015475 [Rhipicephalus sanguineus]
MFGRVWFNLHKQQLQPRDQSNTLCNSCCSVKVHLEEAYNGGGCLRVLFKPNRNDPAIKHYIRYTFKNISFTSSVGQDIAIVLKARSAAGETEEIYLGMTAGLPEGDNYTVSREIIKSLEDATEDPHRETNVCLLGQLDVRRPADAEKAVTDKKATDKAVASDDSSSDDESERKRFREEQYGLDAVIAE